MLPFIAGATIYLRRRETDPRVAPSRQSDILTWIAFVAITAVAAYSTFDQLRGCSSGSGGSGMRTFSRMTHCDG